MRTRPQVLERDDRENENGVAVPPQKMRESGSEKDNIKGE